MSLYGMMCRIFACLQQAPFESSSSLTASFRTFCVPESSIHEGSNDNDGSVCGSDSAFYKQSEGERCSDGRAAFCCTADGSFKPQLESTLSLTLYSFFFPDMYWFFPPPLIPFSIFLKRFSVNCSLVAALTNKDRFAKGHIGAGPHLATQDILQLNLSVHTKLQASLNP